MRSDEAFVAHALVGFLGGPFIASATDGDDPPDLYLHLTADRVAVEVTRLPEPMFDPYGTSFNRATHDMFAMRLLDELNANLGPSLPDTVSLCVCIRLPVRNGTRFKKSLTDWVGQVIAAPKLGIHQQEIDGSAVEIRVIPRRQEGKRIAGFVTTKSFVSCDILQNARLILEERIRAKSAQCSGLMKPIWLVMLNDYFLADADTYQEASRQLTLSHCFNRLFIVSHQSAVNELVLNRNSS